MQKNILGGRNVGKKLTRGQKWQKKHIRGEKCRQKNLLDDLPGVKKRKDWVKMAKKTYHGGKVLAKKPT